MVANKNSDVSNGQRNSLFPNGVTATAICWAKSTGWGGRDRTSEWRNQNPLETSIKSTAILKFWVHCTI